MALPLLVAALASPSELGVEIAAGVAGGLAKTLLLFPLDTLTTLREVRSAASGSYYAGCGVALLGVAPYALIFHTAFHITGERLSGLPNAARQVCAGTAGSLCGAVLGVPFECIKHRVQLRKPGYYTARQALSTTLRVEGARGLFSGLGSTLARNVPYNALHFGLFALASEAAAGLGARGASADALAGAIAGALTALLTTPLDLVNTRLQTQAVGGASSWGARYTGVGDALVRIVREDGGAPALFRSAGVRMAQYAPAAVVFFVVYEAVKARAAGVCASSARGR